MQKIICLLFIILLSDSASAKQKVKWTYPERPYPTSSSVYEISGRNNTDVPANIIIRIDDSIAPDYARRVNEERWVLPGPFKILVQPASLQTPQNKFPDLAKVTQLIVFSDNDVSFDRMREAANKPLKASSDDLIFAYDFGDEISPTYPGFQKIDETSSLFLDSKPIPFIRKSADSLIRDGLKNVTRMEIPLSNGNWRVHLWTEDIGEWETLPPLYERRIRMNGVDMSVIRRNNHEWVDQRYLAGQSRSGAATPWQAFGRFRGNLSSHTVNIDTSSLRIDFAGSNSQATTITAMLIEKLENKDKAFNEVQKSRKIWFSQRWPHIRSQFNQSPTSSIRAFAGETLFLPLVAKSPIKNIETNTINVNPLSSELSFQRSKPNSGLLVRSFHRFSPNLSAPSVKNMLRINIPNTAQSGVYPIQILFENGQEESLAIRIIEFKKPKLNKSIGVYLEPALHLKEREAIEQQIWCDLDFIDQLGFTAIAPPLSKYPKDFLTDLTRANSFGFRDILSYTTIKQMDKRDLESLLKGMDAAHIKQPIWSIADEPSNAGQAQELKQHADFLQSTSQFAKKAGHLNSIKDLKLLKHLNLALVNGGVGLNFKTIKTIKDAQVLPWFYNMENRRLAAGFYLWRMQMDGYMQWHGRMPTADSFDPTDGREDDVQLIYPSLQPCPAHPDIDIGLIEMVNGLSDLRWLLWLDERAENNKTARVLREQIMTEIPTNWINTQALSEAHWDKLRSKIQDLAFQLQN